MYIKIIDTRDAVTIIVKDNRYGDRQVEIEVIKPNNNINCIIRDIISFKFRK